MAKKDIFVALICAAAFIGTACQQRPSTRGALYLDIEQFYKTLGHLWIIATATANEQANTACKFYDVTSVNGRTVSFRRIYYKNGTKVQKELTGRLKVEDHPVVAKLMNYNHVMRVYPPGRRSQTGDAAAKASLFARSPRIDTMSACDLWTYASENMFEERLLYQSIGNECGIFNVRSLIRRLHITRSNFAAVAQDVNFINYADLQMIFFSGIGEFYELRLWNSSAVSPYKECLKAYVERVPNGNVITTYYNGLCKNILTK
ncbi:uncharacterized protein LOC125946888 isoform X1 [Dermacentor silvarum]|uniref:uncharacterized protein LOC125946888 isoform X1 n=1 Tax=Dermacentor silvarum TaxID=543639 RepID=UPI0021012617|nr:uncharacterized protein LOC125946888 isoform X1 [Dermacentor silvarum]XP_049527013.1 uncharacterized protein LOC125946888 isoform X1 [Dermacentor silvarum]XP_049527014.1 uncharacterized protein LOC125946888 isoform X1 [Dermacentor silvarum]XP_049527015.1 uncharacterized protein LOC125946888 isoform X1 [Dermacentor silvarum]